MGIMNPFDKRNDLKRGNPYTESQTPEEVKQAQDDALRSYKPPTLDALRQSEQDIKNGHNWLANMFRSRNPKDDEHGR